MRETGFKIEKIGNAIFIKIGSSLDALCRNVHLAEEFCELMGAIRLDGDIQVVGLEAKSAKGSCVNEKQTICISDNTSFPLIAEAISRIEVPVIAAVEGDVVGLGLEWFLACDIRIAEETSRFGLTHITSGLLPFDGGIQRLARLVGRSRAAEMVFTGECIDAPEALTIGLVNRIVPASEGSELVMKLAKNMLHRSSISMRYVKEAICKGVDLSLEQGLRLEADLYFLMHTTHDRKEGIRAFQEKRKPSFKGE